MIVDYHMHLRAADGSIEHTAEAAERFVEQASAREVDEIGFTEHVYYFEQTKSLWSVPYQVERCHHDLDVYCDAVLEAKRRGLPVKLGLEVDFQPHLVEETAAILEPYPWDYLLGSVHFLDGFSLDGEPSLIGAVGAEEAWARYFGWLESAVESGLVDVLAHPDLIKFFGDLELPDAADADYENLCSAAKAAGVCLEVSTAGLYKPVGELYPSQELLRTAHAHGVGITLASDAHEPGNVGRDFDRALAHAREAGYETVTVFERRRARQEPLG